MLRDSASPSKINDFAEPCLPIKRSGYSEAKDARMIGSRYDQPNKPKGSKINDLYIVPPYVHKEKIKTPIVTTGD